MVNVLQLLDNNYPIKYKELFKSIFLYDTPNIQIISNRFNQL